MRAQIIREKGAPVSSFLNFTNLRDKRAPHPQTILKSVTSGTFRDFRKKGVCRPKSPKFARKNKSCNRKGNDATSRRALWKKHVSPEEQETFLSKLHTLTAADLEEFQHKFGEAMMLRIYEVYENDIHTDTLGYNQGLNELRENVEKSKIDRANEIGESTPQKKMRVRDRHSTVKRENVCAFNEE